MSDDFQWGTGTPPLDVMFPDLRRVAPPVRVRNKSRIASLRKLAASKGDANGLVRMSERDFWKISESEDGMLVERLVGDDVDESGE